MTDVDPEQLSAEIRTFISKRTSLQLATHDKHKQLNVSYAPFAVMGEQFYILISQLARHCSNLQEVPESSIMLIEDETQCHNPFARKRLIYQVSAHSIERGSASWDEGMAALIERFGPFAKQLSSLADFELFRLKVKDGQYVKGFGRAFSLTGNDLSEVDDLMGQDKKSAR
ncbi:HugZ family protein [Gynuella sp.]|uniref:HugZ family pyridoxamine 5'-phosphate oxidase n=1 Tax=Gynuella sp. TaxID=2969146 RepID=UPI003D13369E